MCVCVRVCVCVQMCMQCTGKKFQPKVFDWLTSPINLTGQIRVNQCGNYEPINRNQ